MKRILIIGFVLIMGSNLNAQTDAIASYFDKYIDDSERFNYAHFSGKMFQMISRIEMDDPEEQKLLEESVGKVKGVKVLHSKSIVDGAKLYKEALSLINGEEFDELMSVREDDKDIKFFIKEKNNKIDELFMVMGGSNEFNLLSVYGDGIDLNMLYKLSKKIGMDGFEELEFLDDKRGG